MSVAFATVRGRLIRTACVAGIFMLVAAIAGAQSPTLEQLNALKTLPQDQQQTLIQSVLGNGDSTNRKTDSKLESTDATETGNDRLRGLDRPSDRSKTPDGRTLRQSNEDPELRPGDSVLIDLTPIGLAGSDNYVVGAPINTNSTTTSPPPSASSAAAAALTASDGSASTSLNGGPGSGTGSNATGNKGAPVSDFGRTHFVRNPKTREEIDRSAAIRLRILNGNPYKLNTFGVLEIPGLPSIPLAGLAADEATRRLSADSDLRDFSVKLSLLRLDPIGDEGVKAFGYDLFQGVPSTFAPVKDIQVPIDYVVGPGDTLNVQLYGNNTASYTLAVGRDGRINFPKLGPISVSGMGFDAVRAVLEQRVAQQLIGTQISVTMGDLRSIRVFVLGEAEKPGSYTVSGLSTMTNALFVSGGIKKTGSLRNIELKRNGRLVSALDLYDLLLHGDTSRDRQLMPGDVIFVPPVGSTATIYGAVRRPAIYELRAERTVEELVGISGGLLPDADAKRAQLERIQESRLREMRNIDLSSSDGRDTELANGDKLRIPEIRPTLENSVVLAGDVFRPGAFQFKPGLRLTDILESFDELRPTADRHYVMIRREIPPTEKIEVLSADLELALASRGSLDDPQLKPRDKIIVFDLTSNRMRNVAPIIDVLELQGSAITPAQVVSIEGEVRAPGRYPLEPSMHVSDLIRAGGSLDDAAYTGQAELTRYEVVDGNERQTALFTVDLSGIRRGEKNADLQLKPYDVLVIKKTPQWEEPGSIVLSGEFRYPGIYPIHRGETLSSALRRAGGLTDLAFEAGAVYIREELKRREKEQLEILSNRLQSDLASLSLEALTTSAATNGAGGASAAQGLAVGQQLIEQLRNTKPVGRLVINVHQVMTGPIGGAGDVLLRNGDMLLMPKRTQEITILGEVQSPTSHIYRVGLSRDDYIARSGGTTQKADRKRIYVVRANGDVISGGRSGWFRRTQSVTIQPGDTIVVPLDTERVRGLPLWTSVTTIIYNLAVALLAVHSV